jgi:hypothetical protein
LCCLNKQMLRGSVSKRAARLSSAKCKNACKSAPANARLAAHLSSFVTVSARAT